jgi:hypothetical protein
VEGEAPPFGNLSKGGEFSAAQKVENNSFKIGGGQPGLEVSWQATGIPPDAWVNAHRPSKRKNGSAQHA